MQPARKTKCEVSIEVRGIMTVITLTGHETGLLRDEERNESRDVLWLAISAKGRSAVQLHLR